MLSESNAILRYLAGREERDDLYPTALPARAAVEELLDRWALTFRPAFFRFEAPALGFVPGRGMGGGPPDPAALPAIAEAIAPTLAAPRPAHRPVRPCPRNVHDRRYRRRTRSLSDGTHAARPGTVSEHLALAGDAGRPARVHSRRPRAVARGHGEVRAPAIQLAPCACPSSTHVFPAPCRRCSSVGSATPSATASCCRSR